jgi:hypothetical protein
MAVKAVSEPEKNADISMSINNITARAASLESNKSSPNYINNKCLVYMLNHITGLGIKSQYIG